MTPTEKRPRLELASDNSSQMTANIVDGQDAAPTGAGNMKPLTDDMRGWKERVTENADWEMYYTAQGICVDAAELALMKETFQAPLPVAIRVNKSASLHTSVENHLAQLSQLDESRPNKCSKLAWSVDGNAWQWNDVSRMHVRKDPSLVQLKKWLVDHESVGTLTRQEAVSMVPPIVLAPQPGEYVLDMCAAPGSKTCQMIESLQTEGVVVANDVEWKRANMLSHQVQRLSSPANIVCNVDATHFPSLAAFDKVLCDVPCTGDGTIRKAQGIWRRWSISDGNGVHQRQFQILCRGIQLLKAGGTLVYSTCSLNPIENEAVVAAALAKFKDIIELVPADDLPGLHYRQGLASWKVYDDKTKLEVEYPAFALLEREGKGGKLKSTMYPPTDPEIAGQMKNACRFLPHLMNTGGFFVAKLVRKADAAPKAVTDKHETKHGEFVQVSQETYDSLTSFYGLDTSRVSPNQFYIRENQFRHIYFVSKDAAEFLTSCGPTFKLVSIGVRAFAEIGKWDSPCQYRLTQEGVDALRGYIQNDTRTGTVSTELFIELLETREIETDRVPQLMNLSRGGASVTNGTVGVAVMVSPFKVQVYAEKLHCDYMLSILKGIHDPTVVTQVATPATTEPATTAE